MIVSYFYDTPFASASVEAAITPDDIKYTAQSGGVLESATLLFVFCVNRNFLWRGQFAKRYDDF